MFWHKPIDRLRLRQGSNDISLQIVFRDIAKLEEVPEKACLERLMAENWNGQSDSASRHSQQPPAVLFDRPAEILAGNLFQTAISRTH